MRNRRLLAGALIVTAAAMASSSIVDAATSTAPTGRFVGVHHPARSAGGAGPVGAGATVSQTVQLNVAGGAIDLQTTEAHVTLTRKPGSANAWVGMLPSVRVVDARGTLVGWQVRWHLVALEVPGASHGQNGAMVEVDPGAPVVIDGEAGGLHAGRPGQSRPPGRTLMRADADHGGGTYEGAGAITVMLPASTDAELVSVRLSFTVR